ncbi:MAG: hypothetical protein K0S05_3249, partial [Agromyces sp.]|nr:hypothetical protein [Agromyces sp.]
MQQRSPGARSARATAGRGARQRFAAAAALATASVVGLSLFGIAPAQAAEVTHTIAQVQGTGASTPLSGATVTVEGVVTADHRVGGYAGFYIQTPGPDTTPGASDGIFVWLDAKASPAFA